MTSLLCVKSLQGNVEVHDKESADGLIVDEEDDRLHIKYMPRGPIKKTRPRRPSSTPIIPQQASRAPSMDAGYLISNTMKMQDWLSKKQVKDIQDVSEYLDHTDLLELRKKELLHKNWNDRVYEPIRRKILDAMNGQDWLEKDRRRRELHRQYLEHLNRKGHVFLDTMDQGEYYAQALNNHRPAPITIQTPNLHDPLLAQGRERNKEEQTVLRCTTGEVYSHSDIDQVKLPPLPLVPLGRHGTDCVGWLEMPLGNIESTPRKASRLRMKGNCTQTQIDFNEWSKLAFDSRVVDHEMQLQKKRMFEEKPPYGVPARQFTKAPFACATTSSEHKGLCPVNT